MSSWSELPEDLGDSILHRLRRHEDRVCFGAVCRQWRSCARRNNPPPQFPWLALSDQTFYSLSDSSFRPLPLRLDFHRQEPHAQSSCGEWLAYERIDGAYTLVNPFSKAITMVLPRLSAGRTDLVGAGAGRQEAGHLLA
ncbi:putative aquaporin TIP3-2 [Hordeum vulgare]|nr:putative aquaporin TIP3-2 [Hordeum vulgare]